jgi:REP element-mobilizing transposase RayT
MSQSLARLIVHIVYSTKHHYPWLKDAALRAQLYAYNAAVLRRDVDSPAILINGTEDHIHILCTLSRRFAVMDVIKKSKTETSRWLKKQASTLRDFQWQSGYGIFSVSQSQVEPVKRYIANQEQHHKRTSYQEEFRELCKRHGIAIDERYVWD